MQTIEYRTRDKSEWGHGVWQDEPDKRQWQDAATGFPCLIVRGPGGALCGYVGVSRKHPAFEKEYDSVDVNVHGGLTFASKCAPEPTHERWQEWRKRVLGGADEAKRYPQGDAARRLKERAMELEDYEAYVAWATGSFICHKVDAGEDDEVWWLGFDCAHLGDYSPAFDSKRSYGYADDTYKDFPYVTREVERLAVQLKQMGGASNKEGGKS